MKLLDPVRQVLRRRRLSRELIEAMLRKAVRQRSAEHLKGMLGEQQRIDDTVQAAAWRGVRGFRLRRQMSGLRSG